MSPNHEHSRAKQAGAVNGTAVERATRRRWPLVGTIAAAMLAGACFALPPLASFYSMHRTFTALSTPGISAADKQRIVSRGTSTSVRLIAVGFGLGTIAGVIGLGCFFVLLKDLQRPKKGEREQ
jgi:hypothetical protein